MHRTQLVDVGEERAHARGPGLEPGEAEERVEPHQPPAGAAEPRGLAREDARDVWVAGDTLYLGRGVPRAWMQDGKTVEFRKAPTYFGPMDMKITSVSKKEERSFKTPAAVFVVTNEEIRRSGARNIQDALRLVPGVQVAQIDANKWAVSVRGD